MAALVLNVAALVLYATALVLNAIIQGNHFKCMDNPWATTGGCPYNFTF